ncbi:hypothetical protein B0T14DRAFT_561860 [Immersiella caudata]|uniref:LysM domain-containing protein n=1 Tax=Immersiella caudata TaxID=314043 RepID=A0AA39X2D6_9PEZI|nr:hypothetical protein B0T14DRAFT_561860 [Immersiella caudata]
MTLYTIQASDTCNSIAAAQNVSTFAIYGSGGLKDCSSLPAGTKLCLLGQCRSVCTNFRRVVGQYICLSRPDGLLAPTIAIPSAAVLATGTAWPTMVATTVSPLPTAPGTLAGCTKYTNYLDDTMA